MIMFMTLIPTNYKAMLKPWHYQYPEKIRIQVTILNSHLIKAREGVGFKKLVPNVPCKDQQLFHMARMKVFIRIVTVQDCFLTWLQNPERGPEST